MPTQCISLSKSILKTLKASLRAAGGDFNFPPVNLYNQAKHIEVLNMIFSF